MSISPYDFDTQFAPFEAFAPCGPVAPFAFFAMLAAPAQWWMSTAFNMYGALSEAMITSMVYPFAFSPYVQEPHATASSEAPLPPKGKTALAS